jgi:hypothetical protein
MGISRNRLELFRSISKCLCYSFRVYFLYTVESDCVDIAAADQTSIRTQRICTCPGINAICIVNNLNNGIVRCWETHILVGIGGIVLEGKNSREQKSLKMIKFNSRDMPCSICRDPPCQITTKHSDLSPCYHPLFIDDLVYYANCAIVSCLIATCCIVSSRSVLCLLID